MPTAQPINLAVLISGGGTTLANLLEHITAGALNARVKVVISSRDGVAGLDKARAAGITAHVVARREALDVDDFSRRIFAIVDSAGVDLVCLAGFLSLVRLPPAWAGRVMNIHPALLPSFGGRGMYGHHVHEAVLAAGCRVSGCTVHFVDNQYDSGPIIVQRCCPVRDDDTPDTLAARVFVEEKLAYPEAIELYRQGRLRIEGRRVRVVG